MRIPSLADAIIVGLLAATACGEEDLRGRPGVAAEPIQTVVDSVGTATGPAMLTRQPRTITRDAAGGFLITDYNELIRIGPGYTGVIGSRGEGPGEYRMPVATRIDSAGTVWLFDFARRHAARFSSEGAFVDVFRLDPVGFFGDAAFMRNGTLVMSGEGVDAGVGHLLHIYRPATQSWTSYMPYDPTPGPGNPWMRLVRAAPDGTALVIGLDSYLIESVDPSTGKTISLWSGAGPFWESLSDTESTKPRTPVVTDALVNPDGTIWVQSAIPVASAELEKRRQEMAGLDAPATASDIDLMTDTLLELIDIKKGTVTLSMVLPRYPAYLVGSEPTIAYFDEMPFPQLKLVRISAVP